MNDEQEACITDFGLSRILEVSGFTTDSVGGTGRWKAYELLAYEVLGMSVPRITPASDVWAFGMTALEVRSLLRHFGKGLNIDLGRQSRYSR